VIIVYTIFNNKLTVQCSCLVNDDEFEEVKEKLESFAEDLDMEVGFFKTDTKQECVSYLQNEIKEQSVHDALHWEGADRR
jgi:hypothetical protein